MLTINIKIEDEQTEQRLAEEAQTSGKSVDELVKELVDEQFGNPDEHNFEYVIQDVRKHMKVIQYDLTEEEERILAENPDVRPFSHIKDSAKYIHDLRRKPRY
ncbi:hypothetical protein [Persicitalea sp.]|uniref:hypothetical protein n=1 Tax=Persicitalea sp. TaxID=3100273 RepID=UPI0035935EEC